MYVCVQGSVGTGVQVLSVSHSGIKLLKTVKSSTAAPDYFRVLRPYTCVQFIFFMFPELLICPCVGQCVMCESVCCKIKTVSQNCKKLLVLKKSNRSSY